MNLSVMHVLRGHALWGDALWAGPWWSKVGDELRSELRGDQVPSTPIGRKDEPGDANAGDEFKN